MELLDKHIAVLKAYGLNYLKFVYLRQDFESFTFREIPTGKIVSLRR